MRHLPTGRGHHHKSSSTTHAHWLFDEPSGAARDAIGSVALAEVATPGVATTGWLGPAYRSFNGSTQAFAGASTPSASVLTANAWTIGLVWRRRASAAGTILCYGHNTGVATGNVLARLKMSSAGALTFEWEDSGVVLRSQAVATYVLPLNRWTYLHLVRTGATSVQVWANARLVATLAMTAANSGGSLSTWFLGEEEDGTGKIQGDVNSLFVEAKAMSQTEIIEDMRRATLQKFATTVRARVKIKTAAGAYQDFTNLQGHDWVDNFSIRTDADSPCEVLDLSLVREHDYLSLANLVTSSKMNLTNVADLTSYSPAVEVAREVLVDMARVPLGFSPVTADWCGRFHGNIDDVNWGGEGTVKVTARDDGGLLVDDFLREDLNMPITSGGACSADATTGERRASVEEAIQDILNKFSGASAPTLYAKNAANLCLIPWEQKKDSIMAVCKSIATCRTYGFRYRYDEDPAQLTWRPTLYDVGRDRVDADGALTTDDYGTLGTVAKSVHGIRNNVYITFGDKTNINSDGIKVPKTLNYNDATSKASFGGFWRSIFITEGDTSPIDETTESDTMGNAALSDLKDPVVDVVAPVNDAFFEAELDDIYVFAGDNVHFTAAQNLATSSVRLAYANGAGTTDLGLRGKPTLGTRVWLAKDARPGMNAQPWGASSTSNTQNPNHGKERSDIISTVDALMSRTRWASGIKGGLVKNADFDRCVLGSGYMPDNWFFHDLSSINTTLTSNDRTPFSVYGSAKASGALAPSRKYSGSSVSVVTDNLSGSASIKFADNVHTDAISSDFFAVEEGQHYQLEAVLKTVVGSGSSTVYAAAVFIEWYTQARAYISDTSVGWTTDYWKINRNISSFSKIRSSKNVGYGGSVAQTVYVAPSTARFARLVIIHGEGLGAPYTAAGDSVVSIDSLNMFLIAREHFAYRNGSDQSGVAYGAGTEAVGSMSTVLFDAEDYDYGSAYDTGTGLWTAPEDGIWELMAQIRGQVTHASAISFDSLNVVIYSPSRTSELARANGPYENDTPGTTADGTVQVKWRGYMAKGETAEVRMSFTRLSGAPTNRYVKTGIDMTWFRSKLGQIE